MPPVYPPRPGSPAPLAAPRMGAIPLPPALLREGLVLLPAPGGALDGRIYDIPAWKSWSMDRRIGFIQKFTEDKGRDPQIREFAVQILNAAQVPPNQTRAAWMAIHDWVKANVRYSTEAMEQLQSPQYTLQLAATKTGAADCDDMAILIGALGYSLGLPFKLVITGKHKATGRRVQHIHGAKAETLMVSIPGQNIRHLPAGGLVPPGATWSHIYLLVGLQPLSAQTWTFCEPTLPVPLGWDVMYGQAGGGGGPAGRSDLAGAVGARPVPFALSGDTPATSAPVAAEKGVIARTLEALQNAITPEAIIAVAVPTVIGIYAAQAATRAAGRRA